MSEPSALRRWFLSLGEAPAALSSRERIAVIVASVVAALSRVAAIAMTPWDWDEAQFMTALRSFDVALHHPHPPGFPLFIGAAKMLMLAGPGPFRSLQAEVVIASLAILPAMFLLAREARASFDVSIASAALLAFFPNVWFYGGTAFSDVPAMVLVVAAIALLFRGCRSEPSFLAGAVVLAIAGGFRPQNLVIGAVPFLVAAAHLARRRRPGVVIAGVAGVVAIAGISYAIVVHESEGWQTFRETLEAHQQYISRVDSFRSPDRPALWRVFDDFFIRPYRAPLINTIVSLLVILGLILALSGRRPEALAVLAAFAPFCLFAWLILDRFSVSRFSIGYAPLFALLAAEGLSAMSRKIATVVACVTILLMIVWTWPALRVVRTTPSPTAAAIGAIRAADPPAQTHIDVQRLMRAFSEEGLAGYPTTVVDSQVPLVSFGDVRREIFLREGASVAGGARTFSRDATRLWSLARQRYFDVSIVPVRTPAFGDGWYGEERDGARVWRWMGRRGVIALPPAVQRATLRVRLSVPRDALPAAPIVTISIDRRVLDRIVANDAVIDRTYNDVILRNDASSDLIIETDRVLNPRAAGVSADSRDLGAKLEALELQLEIEPQRHPGPDVLPALHRR